MSARGGGRDKNDDWRPEAFLDYLKTRGSADHSWPGLVWVRWEDPYLVRRFLTRIWEKFRAAEPEAERLVCFTGEPGALDHTLTELSSGSLFAPARLIFIHASTPLTRHLPPASLAAVLPDLPPSTACVVSVEGITPLTAAAQKQLEESMPQGRGFEQVMVWRPYQQRPDAYSPDTFRWADEIFREHGLSVAPAARQAWVDRVGGHLNLLDAECARMEFLSPAGPVTPEKIEDVLDAGLGLDETFWEGMYALVDLRMGDAQDSLERWMGTKDVYACAAEIGRTLSVARLIKAAPDDARRIFTQANVRSRRRQERLALLARRARGFPPDLPQRLLDMDIAVKTAKLSPGRIETLFSYLLGLVIHPESRAAALC